jgi:hypothetical protein
VRAVVRESCGVLELGCARTVVCEGLWCVRVGVRVSVCVFGLFVCLYVFVYCMYVCQYVCVYV